MVLLVLATTIQEFNDDTSSGNMSFRDVNTTVKYVNLTTAKIKNATIEMAGFVNLTKNTSFSDVYQRGSFMAWNGSYFFKATKSFDAELIAFSINGSTFTNEGNIKQKWNFSFYATSSVRPEITLAFNNSELWIINDSHSNDKSTFRLIKTDFPNNPIGIDTEIDVGFTGSFTSFDFINYTVIAVQRADKRIDIFNFDGNKVSENHTILNISLINSLIWDGDSIWVAEFDVVNPNEDLLKLNPNNFSQVEFLLKDEGTADINYLVYNQKDIFFGGNQDIRRKYFGRGFPLNLWINVGNDSTVEYMNLTENRKNTSTIDLTSGFNNYISGNCAESKYLDNCTVPIIFNSTAGMWAFSNLNITQNDIPNATNVSITPLPITAGTDLKGHCNYSDSDNDLQSGNQTYWYVNKSIILEANNSYTLKGGNVTELANITFSCRVNDSYDWSDWVNSSTANVGDATKPALNNCTLSTTSITDASGNTINFTCTATDVSSNILSMSFDINGTLNITKSFSFTQAQTITTSYIIYESFETLKVGFYSISNVTVKDTSGNTLINHTNSTHWIVTSAPTPSVTPPPSGGGGGIPFIPSCPEGFVLKNGNCINESLYNISFMVIGLKNIEPIILYSGGKQQWRYTAIFNKEVANASFEKPVDFNVIIIGNKVLITKDIEMYNLLSRRIEGGKLRIIDTTGRIIYMNLSLRVWNIVHPITWIIIAGIILGIVFRKKIKENWKKIIKK